MKVAMVTSWKVRCGIFTYTENLSEALVEEDVDVYIVRLPRFGVKTTSTFDVLLSKVPVDKVDLVHCFPSDTQILTVNGIKGIQDVETNDLVFTHTGIIGRVSQIFKRPYKGQLITLKAKYNKPIQCTSEHPFYIVRNKWKDGHIERYFRERLRNRKDTPSLNPEWIPAKEINIGDYVALPKIQHCTQRAHISILDFQENFHISGLSRRNYAFEDGYILSKARKKRIRLCKITVPVNKDFCRLLGYYIAEGSGKGTHLRFSLNINEGRIVDDIEYIIQTLGFEGQCCKYRQNNGLTLDYSCRPLASLFRILCGIGARNKHLPIFWTSLSKDMLSEIIKGVWIGDGTTQKDGYSITSFSKTLCEQLRLAFISIGVAPSVYSTSIKACGRGIKTLESLWNIKHPATSKHNFRDFAHFSENYVFYKINKKETKSYDGEVYNLEVEGDNSYIVGGYTVHNCQHEYGLYQAKENYFFPILKSLGKPVVTTMHAVGNWDTDLIVAKYSDQVVVHNEYCARRLHQPCVIIPHGAKPQPLVPQDKARKSIGIPTDVKIVGYCGFISSYKGLEALIEAVSKVPNVYLLIGGGYHTSEDTAYMNQLRETASQKIPKRCHWLGYVSDEDLAKVYSAMDIVVYPSRLATESGALIMALSHGKAVIASNLLPFKEKEKVGALTTYKSIDDLANKIKKLLKNDALRKQYEQKAMEYAEKTSWTNIAKLHKTLYEDVLTQKKVTKEVKV